MGELVGVAPRLSVDGWRTNMIMRSRSSSHPFVNLSAASSSGPRCSSLCRGSSLRKNILIPTPTPTPTPTSVLTRTLLMPMMTMIVRRTHALLPSSRVQLMTLIPQNTDHCPFFHRCEPNCFSLFHTPRSISLHNHSTTTRDNTSRPFILSYPFRTSYTTNHFIDRPPESYRPHTLSGGSSHKEERVKRYIHTLLIEWSVWSVQGGVNTYALVS